MSISDAVSLWIGVHGVLLAWAVGVRVFHRVAGVEQ